MIELLIVVSIIVSSLGTARNKANDTISLNKGRELQKAVEIFNLDNNRYPTSGKNPVYVASDCAENSPNSFGLNWVAFTFEMGDLLPESFALNQGAQPYCVYYVLGGLPHCPEQFTDYVIVFGTQDTIYSNLSSYYEANTDKQQHCLYPL